MASCLLSGTQDLQSPPSPSIAPLCRTHSHPSSSPPTGFRTAPVSLLKPQSALEHDHQQQMQQRLKQERKQPELQQLLLLPPSPAEEPVTPTAWWSSSLSSSSSLSLSSSSSLSLSSSSSLSLSSSSSLSLSSSSSSPLSSCGGAAIPLPSSASQPASTSISSVTKSPGGEIQAAATAAAAATTPATMGDNMGAGDCSNGRRGEVGQSHCPRLDNFLVADSKPVRCSPPLAASLSLPPLSAAATGRPAGVARLWSLDRGTEKVEHVHDAHAADVHADVHAHATPCHAHAHDHDHANVHEHLPHAASGKKISSNGGCCRNSSISSSGTPMAGSGSSASAAISSSSASLWSRSDEEFYQRMFYQAQLCSLGSSPSSPSPLSTLSRCSSGCGSGNFQHHHPARECGHLLRCPSGCPSSQDGAQESIGGIPSPDSLNLHAQRARRAAGRRQRHGSWCEQLEPSSPSDSPRLFPAAPTASVAVAGVATASAAARPGTASRRQRSGSWCEQLTPISPTNSPLQAPTAVDGLRAALHRRRRSGSWCEPRPAALSPLSSPSNSPRCAVQVHPASVASGPARPASSSEQSMPAAADSPKTGTTAPAAPSVAVSWGRRQRSGSWCEQMTSRLSLSDNPGHTAAVQATAPTDSVQELTGSASPPTISEAQGHQESNDS